MSSLMLFKFICVIVVLFIMIFISGSICYILSNYDEQQNIETTIEENYKDCAFIEYNQFYFDGKLYQYRLDSSESKVIIICKDDGAKEVESFNLED